MLNRSLDLELPENLGAVTHTLSQQQRIEQDCHVAEIKLIFTCTSSFDEGFPRCGV